MADHPVQTESLERVGRDTSAGLLSVLEIIVLGLLAA